MNAQIMVDKALAALLSTQLLAAEVYSTFLRVSSEGEADLWKSMLNDELEHVRHVHSLQELTRRVQDVHLPLVNIAKIREVANRSMEMGEDLFLLRLEGALRLECAELDYGLEGLVARRLERSELSPGFPGDVAAHIERLMAAASRYSESPNIGLQMKRLSELRETSLKTVPIVQTL